MNKLHSIPLLHVATLRIFALLSAATGAQAQTSPCLQWSTHGPGDVGVNAEVHALTSFDDDGAGPHPAWLYVGGTFTSAGAQPASGIARWNGWDWSSVGAGLGGGAAVRALVVYDDGAGDALYAAGSFGSAGGVSASSIARWTGSAWQALGPGLPSTTIQTLAVLDTGAGPALYAAGGPATTTPTSGPAGMVHRWNGAVWSTLPGTFDGTILALLAHDDDGSGPQPASLYACGRFTSVSGVGADRIARWNGASWSALGAGLNDTAYALHSFDSDGTGPLPPTLVVGGSFTNAGGASSNRIATWNGAAWSSLGSGANGEVRALTTFDDGSGLRLVAGGSFTFVGGNPIAGIARWNGSQWSGFRSGGSGVLALTGWKGPEGLHPDLHAGGSFTTIGGVASAHIGQWLSIGCDAQNLENDEILGPLPAAPPCGTPFNCSSNPILGDYHAYIPTDDTPIKQVQVNFHVFNRSDGTGNFSNSPAGLAALQQLIDWTNDIYAQGACTPTDPCPFAVAPHDSRIRFCLSNVYFYNSTSLWNSNQGSQHQTVAFGANASTRDYLNVYFIGAAGSQGQSGDALLPRQDRAYDQSIRLYLQKGEPATPNWAGTLAHEFAHCLGLGHAYNSECAVEPCDYLNDLFCAPLLCPHDVQWDGDSSDPMLRLTNNLMGGTKDSCHLTNTQMGRAHRTLSTTSMQKYVKEPDCVPVPSNLALWMTFDEANGTAAHNAAGGNNGTHVNGPLIGAGKVNRALYFDGVSGEHVRVGSYPAINIGLGDLSISAWVRRYGSGRQVIAEKRFEGGGVIRGYSLFVEDHITYGQVLRFQIADGTANDYGGNFTTDMPADGLWHHVAVTVHRNDSLGGAFYIDGVQQPVRFPTNTHNGQLSSGAPLTIGGRAGTDSWNGWIDDVQVVRRALTAAEVAACHAAGSAGHCDGYCTLPWDKPFCAANSSVTVQAQVCNASPLPQTYVYWFRGLELDPNLGCSINGPDGFTPCSGTITVPGGTCAPITVQIARPTGMTAVNLVGCYELNVQSLGTELVTKFHCRGSVQDRRDLCVQFPGDSPVLVGPVWQLGAISVTNTSGSLINQGYQFMVMRNADMLPDTTAVSLNGLPPGTPAGGVFSLAPGASSNLALTVQFQDYQPLQTYTLVLQADMDGDGAPDPLGAMSLTTLVENDDNPGIGYCSGSAAPCPCGNVGAPDNGCANSPFASGARLTAHGSASISNDTIVLTGTSMPNSTSLVFQGTAQASAVFGDGVRCLGGSIVRFPPRANTANMNSYPRPGDPSVSVRGNVRASGGARYYQMWFRDAASFCTPATFNLTNGYRIEWTP